MQWVLLTAGLIVISIIVFGMSNGLVLAAILLAAYFGAFHYRKRHGPKVLREIGEKGAEAAANKDRAADAEADFVKAEYGVPHCNFERTPEGFRVTFNRAGLGSHAVVSGLSNPSGGAAAVGSLVGLVAVGAFALAKKAGKGTTIEVTRRAVIIDDKKMTRRDFVQFSVAKTWKAGNRADTLAVLGYQYGSRSFEFGGAWDEGQAAEVASSLNHELRMVPMEGDEERKSPEALRAARPTDF